MRNYTMRYDKELAHHAYSPGDWNMALPLGNGSLGAMMFGGAHQEFLQLNEETLWYKGVKERVNPDALSHLKSIQELLLQGNISEAEELVALTMHSTPAVQGHYEPLANVVLKLFPETEEVIGYERGLNLNDAIAYVDYQCGQTHMHRELFCSAVDHVAVIYLHTKHGSLDMIASLQRDKCFDRVDVIQPDTIALKGNCGGEHGVKFSCALRVASYDGECRILGDKLVLKGGSEAVIYVSGHTDFYQEDPLVWNLQQLSAACEKGYEQIRADHLQEYHTYFDGTELQLEHDTSESMYVEAMLQQCKAGGESLALCSLYFQYTRYLMISSSRADSLPANLQGIWNKEYQPSWDCKYTININTEMNYWPVEVSGLSRCHEALFTLLKRMWPNGKQVASQMYGIDGFVAHHNTDIWGDCAPQGAYISSSQWNMGAAWLCTHIYEHYAFTMDEAFLREYYPMMKDAARFLCSFLIEDEQGRLISAPSTSPENAYYDAQHVPHHICAGPTSDIEIIKELLANCMQAAEILQEKDCFYEIMKQTYEKLPPFKIGKFGQLQEWLTDVEEVEPGHRHCAHMLALYPFAQITPEMTPELAAACQKTLERRYYYGTRDGSGWLTGWAHAWMINIWARLKDGKQAYEHLHELLSKYTTANLFDLHPPFQIDGNFGALAGMCEMLLQSHSQRLQLLPALPEQWASGQVVGLHARGGYVVSMKWQSHQLQSAEIKVQHTGMLQLQLQKAQTFYINHQLLKLQPKSASGMLLYHIPVTKSDIIVIQ